VVINVTGEEDELTRSSLRDGFGTLRDEIAVADEESIVAGRNVAALFDAIAALDFDFLKPGVNDFCSDDLDEVLFLAVLGSVILFNSFSVAGNGP